MLIWDAHFRTGKIKEDEVVVNYSGWYGLGPKDYTENAEKHWAGSTLSYYKDSKKISQMVTAVNTCKGTSVPMKDSRTQGFYIQYGGWSKKEAGITTDLTTLTVSKKGTW